MKNVIWVLLFPILINSCSKGSSTPPEVVPENLVVTADIAADNSGNVSFSATATNAVTYDYDYGNGVYQTVATGKITYKYPASGNYTVNVTAKSSSGKTISKSISITVNVVLRLVWSEEFDVDGSPNSGKWGYDIGTGSGGWGNNELQYYTNRTDNAVVLNGKLIITAKKEAFSGSGYTSARLLTKDKFSFKYGKIEVSAKLPVGGGTWPAIWMLGSNINTVPWPACGEIDIMEHVGNTPNKIYGTVHYPGFSGGNAVGGFTNIPNVSSTFHTYTVEWSPSTINWLVDGTQFFSFANKGNLPFNDNFFIILNVAMGGNFGGAIDPAFTGSTMEVDYVRVYQ